MWKFFFFKNMGHLKGVTFQKHQIKPSEDLTKTEKAMSMSEFKKVVLEDEIVEVINFSF